MQSWHQQTINDLFGLRICLCVKSTCTHENIIYNLNGELWVEFFQQSAFVVCQELFNVQREWECFFFFLKIQPEACFYSEIRFLLERYFLLKSKHSIAGDSQVKMHVLPCEKQVLTTENT